jgi:fumarylacetoacetase
MDATHDPGLVSWVSSANSRDTDFPIQNLPFGIFGRDSNAPGRVGVAVGEMIVDMTAVHAEGLLEGDAEIAGRECTRSSLNDLMALGQRYRVALRSQLSDLLRAGSIASRIPGIQERILVKASDVTMRPPARIGGYTDFYASVYHASNVGALFRPDNPLLPNYKWVPIGYHGRASSIIVSGTPVTRPSGQMKAPDSAAPTFGPTRSLDYEAELGLYVARGNSLAQPVPIDEAESHLFGVCLLNDWSARDVQSWEYQPLGPFLSKDFATTISPWVVTMEALEPFRAPPFQRPSGDPSPLPYLTQKRDIDRVGLDITLEVWVSSREMREKKLPAVRLSQSSTRELYWTPGQLLAHHTCNGCNLQPGDLLATGTVSGPTPDALGCLLEITKRGATPLTLPSGERRAFLEDGDEVTLRGYCARDGAATIGLGECKGEVQGAYAGSGRDVS